MNNRLTRRQLMKQGTAAAGLLASTGGGKACAWPPGPGKSVRRDLAPGPTPIRLADNIKRKGAESPEEMIRRKHELGFAAVKGARHPGGNKGEPWHSMTMAERREVVEACKKYDVVIYEVGGYTNLVTPDDARLRTNLKGLAHCIEVAESVGCPMVGTVAGCRDPKYLINPHPDNWTIETWNLLVRSIRQVLRDTAGMKAVIGMEAQVTTIIDSPEAHKRLMEDVGDERLKVNLDPVNMMHLGLYYHTTDLIDRCFDLLGEDIVGCHAKDTYIWPDKQTVHVQEVCPGKGVLDYDTYLVRMSRLSWPRALEPE
ncbi:MAG: sugar phosphate isomerase/epimerase, partial [Candidatus Latescibacteria bacterium]|nr:sugar phosphate isomerase/epimerase [Candidatus Latescibacterota bacterium]